MKLFPIDPYVTLYETGFERDTLERRGISKQLSELVEKLEDPVVLALDDKWGSGKTYFLKRWVAAHTRENAGAATTVYFDAFENDYLSEPLVSLIGAISERIPPKQEDTLTKLKDVGAKLVKPAFGIALSLATFGAKQHLEEMGDAIAEAASGEAKDAASGLWAAENDRKDAIQSFKSLLKELTEGELPPLVIVVDELDRCRPDYALSVLEIIKHFFSAPKVHFILGINGDALQNSVKARYGADIDAERYLRKFINISFSLPRTIGGQKSMSTLAAYATNASKEMALPEIISDRCIFLMKICARNNEISLRDVGKILSKIALLPGEVTEKNHLPGHLDILSVLLVSSVVAPKFHASLISGSASAREIMDFMGATEVDLSPNLGEKYNSNYNERVANYFVTTLYCANPEELNDLQFLPDWKCSIGERFNRFGTPPNQTEFPSNIQRNWVDVFRL